MSRRAEIWIGDLLRAIDALGLEDPVAIEHALRVLGVNVPRLETETPQEPDPSDDRATRARPVHSGPLPPAVLPPSEESDLPALPVVGTEPWEIPKGWQDVEALQPVEDRHRAAVPPYRPLFTPVGTRPLLTAALATNGPGRAIDVDEILRHLARAEPLESIPYRPWPSLFRGVRILLDLHPSMEPFRRDQNELINDLEKLVGHGMVEVEWYDESPLRGAGPGPVGSWNPFSPPYPGTPVLVVGNLGIGSGADVLDDWLTLANVLRQRESRIVAFVPYPRRRWPEPLARNLELVVWDRPTQISDMDFRVRP